MIESLYNKHLTDTLVKAISENFKLVEYLKIEDDITEERQYTNEYSVRYYAMIQNKDKDIYEQKRPILYIFIRFKDNTGFKMKLTPEDYLGKIQQTEYDMKDKIPFGLTVKNHITECKRGYDFNKMFNTILSTLKGQKQYNPTLETLDLITN
jgi:hypothetical protein